MQTKLEKAKKKKRESKGIEAHEQKAIQEEALKGEEMAVIRLWTRINLHCADVLKDKHPAPIKAM